VRSDSLKKAEKEMPMSLDPQLLEILVCPEDKGSLVYVESEGVLLNERLRRTYPVRDDIPVMLIDEASQVSEDEAQRLLSIASA
jgi:uncharacterized protein